MTIETHPLEPFLPENTKILFLGSFPPPKARWSMDFFYPNFQNDFWRIQGQLHYGDKTKFEIQGEKRFDVDSIIAHCKEHGLAFYDTARKVCRLKDNASDNFLDILEPTDVLGMLEQIPTCHTIVTTGGKASEELQSYFAGKGFEVDVPKVGEYIKIEFPSTINLKHYARLEDTLARARTLIWWRMPSTSRAYPMKLEKKAEYYAKLWKLKKI